MERQENVNALENKSLGPGGPRGFVGGSQSKSSVVLEEAHDAVGTVEDRMFLYEQRKAVGKGKFSVVFQGSVRATKRLCALKKVSIFENMEEKSRRKCLKEVELLQTLSHENIIQYLDSFLSQKQLVIVLEWADAGDLKRQIRLAREQDKRFDERLIWKYTNQIARALRHMHDHRIIHRDLKPANIFLTSKGVIKVGDLGLSRFMSESTLEAFSKVGTPLYMAPEVLKGHGYDFKSDIWSLGCILYELAMLRSPFKEKGLALMELFRKIDKAVFPPVPKALSRHIAELTQAMISKDVSRRPSISRICQVSNELYDAHTLTVDRGDEQAQAVTESEIALFRLSLLRYDKRHGKTFPPLYFAYPNASRSMTQGSMPGRDQFDDFVALCLWLLSLLNLSFSPAPEMSDIHVATMLLNCLSNPEEFPTLQRISPAQLCAGYGLSVCLILSRLTDKALEAEDFTLQSPEHAYGELGIDIEDVFRDKESTQENSEEEEEEEGETSFLDEGTCAAEAFQWRKEYVRMKPKLQTTPAVVITDASSEWRNHLSLWKHHGEVLLSSCPNESSSRGKGLLRPTHTTRSFPQRLRCLSDSLERSLSRLRRLERGLHSDFVEESQEMERVRQEMAHGQQRYYALTTAIAAQQRDVWLIQDQLELQSEQGRTLQGSKESMEEAIAEVKADITRIDLAIGTIMTMSEHIRI